MVRATNASSTINKKRRVLSHALPRQMREAVGRRRGRRKRTKRKKKQQKKKRRWVGWKERSQAGRRGYYLGRQWQKRRAGVYPLHVEEVYLRQRDAFFNRTTPCGYAGDASLYSPDNGVTLHSFMLVDLVYFSSLAFNHGARILLAYLLKPLLCRGKSADQE